MKVFLIQYGWFPTAPEASVVIANDEQEAVSMCVGDKSVRVDKIEGGHEENYYSIEEIETDKPRIVYTGHYCC